MRTLALVLGVALWTAGCASAPPAPVLTAYDGQEGGLQFLIAPADAEVHVDAEFKGLAGDFQQDRVLWLPRGLHAVEVRRDGYITFFRQVQVTLGLVEVFVTTLHEAKEVETSADHRR